MHYPSEVYLCSVNILEHCILILQCICYLLYFIRLELRDEWRLENRNAFANIWSDMVYGIVLFLLICFNPSKVSIYQKIMSVSVSSIFNCVTVICVAIFLWHACTHIVFSLFKMKFKCLQVDKLLCYWASCCQRSAS